MLAISRTTLMRLMILGAIIPFLIGQPAIAVAATPANLSDRDLMRIYGAVLRANYSRGTQTGMESPEFKALEKEAESRGLITLKNFEDIQRGIVHLEMPLTQAFASLEDLQLRESFRFESFNLEVYRASTVEYRNGSYIFRRRATMLVCNGKIVGYQVYGVPLFGNFKRKQTNFAPGFFKKGSIAGRRYLRAGRRPPKEPDWKTDAAGGYLWMIFDVATWDKRRLLRKKQWKINPEGRWKVLIDTHVEKGKFPWFVKYFSRHC